MSRILLPDHPRARRQMLIHFHMVAGHPEELNRYYAAEIIDTLLAELALAEGQRDLLRDIEHLGGEPA